MAPDENSKAVADGWGYVPKLAGLQDALEAELALLSRREIDRAHRAIRFYFEGNGALIPHDRFDAFSRPPVQHAKPRAFAAIIPKTYYGTKRLN